MSRGLSPRNFALDLQSFGRVSHDRAEDIFRKISLDLDTRVVLATPVDTGRARANWYPSLTRPSRARDDAARDDPSAAIRATAMRAQMGQVLWLTNNLPYILALENGSSRQAPTGMVDVSLRAVAAQYGGSVAR